MFNFVELKIKISGILSNFSFFEFFGIFDRSVNHHQHLFDDTISNVGTKNSSIAQKTQFHQITLHHEHFQNRFLHALMQIRCHQ